MSFRPSQGYVLGSDGLNPPFLVTVRPVLSPDGSCANFLLFKLRGGWDTWPGSWGASVCIIAEVLCYPMAWTRSGFFKKSVGE